MEFKQERERFYLGEGDRLDAEIHFFKAGDRVINVDHTFVSPSLRGQGVAEDLVKRVVDYAREQGLKIIPTCPFAKKQFERHPEYEDVRQ